MLHSYQCRLTRDQASIEGFVLYTKAQDTLPDGDVLIYRGRAYKLFISQMRHMPCIITSSHLCAPRAAVPLSCRQKSSQRLARIMSNTRPVHLLVASDLLGKSTWQRNRYGQRVVHFITWDSYLEFSSQQRLQGKGLCLRHRYRNLSRNVRSVTRHSIPPHGLVGTDRLPLVTAVYWLSSSPCES